MCGEIIDIRVDTTNIGNIMTFLRLIALPNDDPRKQFMAKNITTEAVKEWFDNLVALNTKNKKFMDVVIQV